uniref:G-protein coupled receptors family 1 profile domain-containing protein n=2 Tax=Denticeps clupeoides TaxID=299321 RepID=A0AAY4CV00_9TELE
MWGPVCLTEDNETDCVLCACTLSLVSYTVSYSCVVLVIFVTVLGNLLVVISVCHFKELHTPTNLLILSLALSDALVGGFVMPFHFVWLIESFWYFGMTACKLYSFFTFYIPTVSVYNVTLIAVDRYIALVDPLLYPTRVSLNSIITVIPLIWAVSFFYNITVLYCNGILTDLCQSCSGECISLGEVWCIIDFVVVFVFPCSTIIIIYIKIFAIVKKHTSAINSQKDERVPNKKDSAKSERKAAKVLCVLVGVFLICMIPCYITSFLSKNVSSQLFNNMLNYVLSLLYLNSSINPIIYALFYPWFKKSIKMIVTLRIFSSNSSLIKLKH